MWRNSTKQQHATWISTSSSTCLDGFQACSTPYSRCIPSFKISLVGNEMSCSEPGRVTTVLIFCRPGRNVVDGTPSKVSRRVQAFARWCRCSVRLMVAHVSTLGCHGPWSLPRDSVGASAIATFHNIWLLPQQTSAHRAEKRAVGPLHFCP
jgi:hypothetical protein